MIALARKQLLMVYQAAIAAVEGRVCVRRFLSANPLKGPVAMVAIGKAAQSMALGAKDALGDQITRALLISKEGHLDFQQIDDANWIGVEGGHPLPNEGSLRAGRALLEFIAEGEEPLLFLLSGGASAVVEVPVKGISLETLQAANEWLLANGLAINEMNKVRKSLSQIKAGGLLSAIGVRSVSALAISDVPDNDPGVIGSGLLTPEQDLSMGHPDLPVWLADLVALGLSSHQHRSGPVPRVDIIADLDKAKQAAADKAQQLGCQVNLHPAFVTGSAADVGVQLAQELLRGVSGVHIWGGETLVELPQQPGRGGRNQHLALAAAQAIQGQSNCCFLSAGTDGTDGPTQDAGALVDGATVVRALSQGFNPDTSLEMADAGSLLAATGDLIQTGPTGTNVMDIMLGYQWTETGLSEKNHS